MGEYIRVRFRFSWPLVVSPGRRAPRRQIWIFSARFYRDILPPILTIICDNTRQQTPINSAQQCQANAKQARLYMIVYELIMDCCVCLLFYVSYRYQYPCIRFPIICSPFPRFSPLPHLTKLDALPILASIYALSRPIASRLWCDLPKRRSLEHGA